MEEKAQGGKQDKLSSLANQERRDPMFGKQEPKDELGLEIDIQLWPEVRTYSSMTAENNI